MEKILFINACIREDSRTLRLARHLLGKLEGSIQEINLQSENIQAISNFETIIQRGILVGNGQTDAPELKYAVQFAEADTIIIAAPYWDLAFPALLKIYMEHVTVTGLTFRYTEEGRPEGMCKARRLFYVMTSGGPAVFNYGYDYISALCRNFYGINDITLFKAENLDIIGNDPEAIMASAISEIDNAAIRFK